MPQSKLETLLIKHFGEASISIPVAKEKLVEFAEEYHQMKLKEAFTFRQYTREEIYKECYKEGC